MREQLILQRKVDAKASSMPVRVSRLLEQSRDSNASTSVTPLVHQVLCEPGQPLGAANRSAMQAHLGHDFSRVRVHASADASASAEAVGARAYTVGHDVVFGAGAYAPDTMEGRQLLAHELTHVAQQTAVPGAATASYAQAESEAEQNSRGLARGHSSGAISAAPAGRLQRRDKPKATVSGERTGTKEGKDKFSFKADLTLPLTDELSFGSVYFLDNLKLSGSGSVSGEALSISPASLDKLKLEMALTLAKLELANVKTKEDALRKGKLSLGATLSASGGPTFSFDPFNVTSSLGVKLTAKFGATTPSLIPSSSGALTLGTSLSGTGSFTQTLGQEAMMTPKAEAKAGLSADFKFPPVGRLGGYNVTAGLTGGASSAITPEKTSSKLSAGISGGLSGKTGGVEHFVKIQVTGDITIDHTGGSATTTTNSIFLGATTGFKF